MNSETGYLQGPRPKPIALIILDGWGHREETDANAISAAHKPNWDSLWHHFPHTLISGSGQCVGLPEGQMGNSEVGHLNMGAGRLVYQDITRIDLAIEQKGFFANEVLTAGIREANEHQRSVHIMGLFSPGGVHSHERHVQAVIDLAAELNTPSLYLHAFLDGRDTPPRSAMASLKLLEAHCRKRHCGQIVSLIGRYYAMDRDQRWERIHKAYDLLAHGKAEYHAESAEQGLLLAYERGESDEFVKATSIHPKGARPIHFNEGDVVIFMNFRADRAREITRALIDPDFDKFARDAPPRLGSFICLSTYDKRFKVPVAFPPQSLKNILGEYLGLMGLRQLRIAETEKYAHVTFFFNGGVEAPYPGEERVLVPSPKVFTYDLQPEMSAFELTERLVQEIRTKEYDLIVCNFANPDMVGHTGNFGATVKAIEAVDQCLGKILKALQETGGELLITADHGNAEKMYDYINNQPHTAHTHQLVPFIYAGRKAEIALTSGKLSDIAPTILYLMGLPVPKEMTGRPLVKLG